MSARGSLFVFLFMFCVWHAFSIFEFVYIHMICIYIHIRDIHIYIYVYLCTAYVSMYLDCFSFMCGNILLYLFIGIYIYMDRYTSLLVHVFMPPCLFACVFVGVPGLIFVIVLHRVWSLAVI